MSRNRLLAGLVTGALLLAACGDDDDSSDSADTTEAAGSGSASGPEASGDCPTIAEGVLTVGTDSPAFEPWFVDDDPTNGEGFESAVAYAVAEQLGFEADAVEWTVVPFNNIFAPGPKDFDFAINQVSITEERDEAVDFSDGYYAANQALVAYEDSPVAGATSVAELRDLRLGAQVGTTSLDFITEVIQPNEDPFVYNDNASAKAALDAQQVDGIVLDLPTALYVSAVEIEGTTVVGQFPNVGDSPEEFGMVFEEGNPLRDCVNEALAALEADGTLQAIQDEWLADAVAPEIAVD